MVRQAELIRQAQDGDKKARDKVVSDNLGLVHAIVRRFEPLRNVRHAGNQLNDQNSRVRP